MRVIAYSRASAADQEEQDGLLRVFTDYWELELVGICAEAPVYTGNRPELQRALATLEAGQADGLVVTRLSHVTRNVADWGALIERYFSGRFFLMAFHDIVDTRTPRGILGMDILASLAKWEAPAGPRPTSANPWASLRRSGVRRCR